MPTLDVAQFDLFGGEKPVALTSPKLALPFQRTEEVDTVRVSRIFGVAKSTVRRMCERKLLRAYTMSGARGHWRIEYASVVEYCDELRVRHHISERRALLSGARRRYRDSDLLPFPLAETIYVPDICTRVGLATTAAIHLIEEGALVGYQLLIDTPGCPWRIHAPSLDRYLASCHAMAAIDPSKRPTFRRDTSMR